MVWSGMASRPSLLLFSSSPLADSTDYWLTGKEEENHDAKGLT